MKKALKFKGDGALKWMDKSAPKHKHDFSVPSVCVLYQRGGYCKGRLGCSTKCFRVLKCSKCNSFINIESVPDECISDLDVSMPVISLSSDSYAKWFWGAELISVDEGFERK